MCDEGNGYEKYKSDDYDSDDEGDSKMITRVITREIVIMRVITSDNDSDSDCDCDCDCDYDSDDDSNVVVCVVVVVVIMVVQARARDYRTACSSTPRTSSTTRTS